MIWCCFLLRGLFCCSVLPLWEGFDEYNHFALVQYLAWHHSFPDFRTASTSEMVAESLRLIPVPWTIRDNAAKRLSYEQYWQLPPETREQQEWTLRHLPLEHAKQPARPFLALYEAQQMPLYYCFFAIFYWPLRTLEMPTKVWLLRCFTVLVASLIVPLGFLSARLVFSDTRMAVAAALVVAAMPELFLSISRISNEGLAVALGSVVILLALHLLHSGPQQKQAILFGGGIGCALLCKAYFLALLPWALAVFLIANRRNTLRPLLSASVACSLIAGFWYERTFLLTGSFTGEQSIVAAQTTAAPFLLHTLGQIQWHSVFDFFATSYLWVGNWSFLVVRSWMYRVVEVLWLLSLFGVVVQLWKPRDGLGNRKQVILLLLPFALLLSGLCYQAIQVFRISGAAGSLGHYLYCLIVPETILLLIGLERLLPTRFAFSAVPIMATLLLALEFFGNWFLLLPYYTGLIGHDAHQNLPAFHPTADKVRTLFERLPVNKPYFLHTSEFVILAVLSVLATSILIGISVWLMTSNFDPGFDTARLRQDAGR